MIKRFLFIRTSFIGFHRWPAAEEKYLRDFHRHKFCVELRIAVERDRQIEFIELKRKIDGFLQIEYENKRTDKSCEEIAMHLMDAFKACRVEVSEDGENGAILINHSTEE